MAKPTKGSVKAAPNRDIVEVMPLSQEADRPFVHVVAGVVIDTADRVLIAQRPEGKHMAGGWEFPGGKLESGEERLAGLARELQEEIGITLEVPPRPLIRIRHIYPACEVLLDVWVIRHYGGEPQGLDGQALRWCTQDELEVVELVPADGPIVAALRLPERLTSRSSPYYSISDFDSLDFGSTSSSYLVQDNCNDTRLRGIYCKSSEEAVAAVEAGVDFLILLVPLPIDELMALCRQVSVPLYVPGIELSAAWKLGASGTNEIDGAPVS